MQDMMIRCRYTREECEEPALYKVGKCDLCFVAERPDAGRRTTDTRPESKEDIGQRVIVKR
jgi:hypothetical protein